MDLTVRPLPTARGEERRYFDDLREHRLPVYRCSSCGTLQAVPFARCVNCAGAEALREWANGTGIVYSFTELHRAGHPAFAGRVPYVVALVDLDEGVRCLADVRADPAARVHIDQRVQVAFDDLPDGTVLPFFEPAVP